MIHIRPSVEDDATVIIGFQIAMALETENINLEKDIVNVGVMSVYSNPEKGRYFVAVYNDRVIGSLMLTPEWSDWRNKWVLWIQSVYVIPEMRGKGTYRMMYDYIVENIASADDVAGLRLYVDLTNTKARKVYEKMGMSGNHYQLFEAME